MYQHDWYNVPMALVQRTINQCDVCGYEWIPRSSGERCGNRECRSTRWNSSAKPEQPIQSPADPAPVGIESLRQVIAAIERKPVPDAVPEPECEQCGYTEYVGELGETMRCGLAVHSGKVKHGNWQAIG